MTLQVNHGTVTWDGLVLALQNDPAELVIEGETVHYAYANSNTGALYFCQWDVWDPAWDSLEHPADWPTPNSVVAV